jgi:hypothetical protein
VGIEFQYGKMQKILEMGGGDGCTNRAVVKVSGETGAFICYWYKIEHKLFDSPQVKPCQPSNCTLKFIPKK